MNEDAIQLPMHKICYFNKRENMYKYRMVNLVPKPKVYSNTQICNRITVKCPKCDTILRDTGEEADDEGNDRYTWFECPKCDYTTTVGHG